MKVVINQCFGGFGLSGEAEELLAQRKGVTLEDLDYGRTDPDLVAVVEALGSRANDYYSDLKIVEIPDDVKWHITEYDGVEKIREDHRTWS